MIMKKIFEGIFDTEVHDDFLKFGRGDFKNRYLLEAKKQSNKWTIKTGPEFVNYLVRECLNKVPASTDMKGIIVTTNDLNDLGFEIKKRSNFQGIKKIEIETEVELAKIKNLIEKYPRAFYALSFKGEDFELKVKAKAPKNGKPGKESEEGPKPNFCTLKTNDEKIIKDLFFDVADFKEINVNHTIFIQDIVYPKDFAKMKPEEVREQSRRKGKIVRKVIVDGNEKISEKEFVA
ncbi:MAG: hypothetical protein Q8N88_04885 [Nanoarchaeota archaeon]|nr:hypothetical protein [Nanoarchaeota archaeon]